ncbi:hypothetical protein PO909_019069 [Leuciscus waleckii]
MSWCEGSGGKMTLVKLLLSLLLLHTFSEASNQPPRFQNYFFQSYLLIYENTPVGECLSQTHTYCSVCTHTDGSFYTHCLNFSFSFLDFSP